MLKGPPWAGNIAPVIMRASSEARKKNNPSNSSGSPTENGYRWNCRKKNFIAAYLRADRLD
jgi:hypothetical protein